MKRGGIEKYLTPKDIAMQTGIGEATVKKLMAAGIIVSINIGAPGKRAYWRATPSAVEDFQRRAPNSWKAELTQQDKKGKRKTKSVGPDNGSVPTAELLRQSVFR